MSNGLSRVEKYRYLSAEEHLRMLDNELDSMERARELLIDKWNTKLNWTLTTFVSLILLVCGTLLAVVIK